MTTEKLLDKIDALGDDTNWDDPNVYTTLMDGESDEGDEAAQGHDASAPAGDTGAAKAEPEGSGAPAAAITEVAKPAEVAGVSTKDGKHIIPYAVLEAERAKAARAGQAEQEAAQLREQLAQLQAQKTAQPVPGTHSEEEIERIANDFPELAQSMRATNALAQEMAALKAQLEQVTAPQQPADDPVQAEIDRAPLLATWQAQGGEAWARAVEEDKNLRNSKFWSGKTMTERFAEVQRRVALEVGAPTPDTPKPLPAAPAADPTPAPAARPTLSDLPGSAPSTEQDVWARGNTRDLLAYTDKLSYDDLMRSVGIPT